MQLKMYSIRDAKAEAYNPPFYKKTHGEAERDFTELTKTPDSMVCKYPEDYDLYFCGTYDDQTGLVESLKTPQHIVKAATLTNR
nr:MAG: nonstructural protein [Microvirus sp.]